MSKEITRAVPLKDVIEYFQKDYVPEKGVEIEEIKSYFDILKAEVVFMIKYSVEPKLPDEIDSIDDTTSLSEKVKQLEDEVKKLRDRERYHPILTAYRDYECKLNTMDRALLSSLEKYEWEFMDIEFSTNSGGCCNIVLKGSITS